MSPHSVDDSKPQNDEPEFVRDQNEDDDGYDPWSDRFLEEPLFEPDPWD